MQRLQRRAYLRVDVPACRIVRASYWIGGRAAEPAGTTVDCPVWSGQVTNISAGGFQLAADANAAEALEVGDTVGVRLIFGAGRESVYADAQYRHHERTLDGHVLMGFQFMGLDQTTEGRAALRIVSEAVNEFQRLAPRRDS
jgi:c-di-GMP-binding flagellar brake protein YcgR